jgi:hypothetical protein
MRKANEFPGFSGIKEPIIIEVMALGHDQGEYALLNQKNRQVEGILPACSFVFSVTASG